MRTARRWIWPLVWAGGIALVVVSLLALVQRSLIYHPDSRAGCGESAGARGFVPWVDAAGQRIGHRLPAAADDPRAPLAVLISHGNAGCALQRAGYAPFLRAGAPDRAVSVYLLEYPGYGQRPGSPSQQTLLAAAADALASIPPGSPVVLLGESLGSGVAAATAGAHPGRVSGLILLSPFDSLTAVAGHHYPVLPVGWLLRDRYPAGEWLDGYRGPVAIVVAGRDLIVPEHFGRALYDGYRGPKLLLIARDAGHNDLPGALPASGWERALDFVAPAG